MSCEDPIEQQVCQQEACKALQFARSPGQAAMQLMMGTEALTPVDYRLPEQRWHVLPSATWAGVVHPEMCLASRVRRQRASRGCLPMARSCGKP